jgi:SPP1 family predicted phage head-tail adaptor
MRAGCLTQRITIQHRTVTGQDSYGQDTVSWTTSTSGPFWAEIVAMQGRELANAQQKWAEARFKVTIRYQSGVTIKRQDRVSWGTRTLDILDAEDPDQGLRKTVMVCNELVD